MSGRIRQWIGYIIMVVGLCFLASPFVTGYIDGNKQKAVVENFLTEMPLEETVAQGTPAATSTQTDSTDLQSTPEDTQTAPQESLPEVQPAEAATPENQSTETTSAEEPQTSDSHTESTTSTYTGDELSSGTTVHTEVRETVSYKKEQVNTDTAGFYEAARAYNEDLYETRQAKLTSTAATERFSLNASQYGYPDNMIGTLWIPCMGVELGMYLGANNDNMAKGAAIFGETSIPLGLPNENTSIAGHRGWCGTAMFRDIQSLQMNDKVYITTTWATLVYKVCDIVIVTPEDNTWCDIREGRSLITLMTCHPYTQHSQRYVVFAELAETLPGNALTVNTEIRTQALVEVEETLDLSPKTIVEYHEDGTTAEVVVDSTSIDPDGSEFGAVWSNVMILAEKQIYTITIGLTGVMVLLGIVLLVGTIRDIRRRSGKGE